MVKTSDLSVYYISQFLQDDGYKEFKICCHKTGYVFMTFAALGQAVAWVEQRDDPNFALGYVLHRLDHGGYEYHYDGDMHYHALDYHQVLEFAREFNSMAIGAFRTKWGYGGPVLSPMRKAHAPDSVIIPKDYGTW